MRPEPEKFAEWSYLLAFISAGILIFTFSLSFLINLVPDGAGRVLSALQQVIWLTILTSAIGTFLGYAARTDLKIRRGFDEAKHKARVGFRSNAAFLGIMLLIAFIAIAGKLDLIPGVSF